MNEKECFCPTGFISMVQAEKRSFVERPSLEDIVVCPDCDLLVEPIHVEPGEKSVCPRCDCVLRAPVAESVEKTLALSLAGLFLFPPAVFLPLLSFEVGGLTSTSSVFSSVESLLGTGFIFTGTAVLLTGILIPLAKLILLFGVSWSIYRGKPSRWALVFLKSYKHLDDWGMLEVYLLGILITIIKMLHMAKIHYGVGFVCFLALLAATLFSSIFMDEHEFWEKLEARRTQAPEGSGFQGKSPGEGGSVQTPETARETGLMLCHACHKVVPSAGDFRSRRCPRCGSSVHMRKPNSIAHTWALVLTAFILFIPANVLPIMEVDTMGRMEYSTILDGIIYFFKEGSYGIGGVILVASILVPLFKIVGIVMILVSVHFRIEGWLRHKTLMFRFIKFIGRWSMLDIFVIALLTALVRFGFLSTILAAPAAPFFCAVVVTTMVAAEAFDTRLLWDAAGEKKEQVSIEPRGVLLSR